MYGWDIDEVARIALATVRAADAHDVELVRFVLFDKRAKDAFERAAT